MNPVLLLTHDNLSLTKKCVASIQAQDVPTWIYLVDNNSSDHTYEWAKTVEGIVPVQFIPQIGVSGGWNHGLKILFECEDAPHVLVVNADTILPPTFYSQLLSCNVPFVTGTETRDLADLEKAWHSHPLGTGPQFSAFLVHRKVWNIIGPFDESQVSWTSDCDYHLRAHRLGIDLLCSPVRYYHERSSTIRNAPPKEKLALEMQADADRLAFYEKWKFEVESDSYRAAFNPEFFGIDAK